MLCTRVVLTNINLNQKNLKHTIILSPQSRMGLYVGGFRQVKLVDAYIDTQVRVCAPRNPDYTSVTYSHAYSRSYNARSLPHDPAGTSAQIINYINLHKKQPGTCLRYSFPGFVFQVTCVKIGESARFADSIALRPDLTDD
jgi:hypothetical protein